MPIDKVTQLGARLLGERVSDLSSALKSANQFLLDSKSYRELLTAFGGAVIFDNGARFMSDERSPLNDKDGFQNLELLYGLGRGKYSIERQHEKYADELPKSFVPIGEAPGGNLICVDDTGAVYLWDHESQRDEGVWRVAVSVDARAHTSSPRHRSLFDKAP